MEPHTLRLSIEATVDLLPTHSASVWMSTRSFVCRRTRKLCIHTYRRRSAHIRNSTRTGRSLRHELRVYRVRDIVLLIFDSRTFWCLSPTSLVYAMIRPLWLADSSSGIMIFFKFKFSSAVEVQTRLMCGLAKFCCDTLNRCKEIEIFFFFFNFF